MTIQNILLTRQRHEADKAGLHYDIRLVMGNKAWSFATKKEMPEVGQSIILHEQPIHTADYALSKRVEIPKGQYGAGVTTLDWVRKAKLKQSDDHHVIETSTGERYLLKHVPGYGEKMWLFRNLGMEKKAVILEMYQHEDTGCTTWLQPGQKNPGPRWFKTNVKIHKGKKNKYLSKIASDLEIAEKSKQEEDKAIKDYKERISKADSADLKDALNHARKEEKDHSKQLGMVLQKLR